jgi:hypothetical protein
MEIRGASQPHDGGEGERREGSVLERTRDMSIRCIYVVPSATTGPRFLGINRASR